jgi:hypothetical protein
MASQKTWVWVVVGIAGFGLLGLILVAGAGVYFVTRHISTERSTSGEAIRSFDEVKVSFQNQKPLYELDSAERPMMTRPFSEIPTSPTKPQHLRLLAWDPHDERLVRIALPFWMLRMHKAKMDLGRDGATFDLEHLNLDGAELERIGPALLFDYRERDGARVLVWTQ